MGRAASPLRLVGALAAAGLLAASAEPLSWWWASAVGVAALVACVRGARLRMAGLTGFVTGAGWTLLLTPWLATVGAAAWWATSVAVGSLVALTAVAMRTVARWPCWPVWTALVWVVGESWWSSWPLGGFPWPRLAWAVVDSPWQGWLAYLSVTGASLAVALCGTALAWVASGRLRAWPRRAILAVPMLGVSFLPTWWVPDSMSAQWTDGASSIRVAAVQGGVPGNGTEVAAHHQEVTDRLADSTVALADRLADASVPDLVVWPENATAVDPRDDDEVRRDLSRASAAMDAPILVGSIIDGPRPGTALNQSRLWRDGEDTGAVYTKRHLVPFGEYVPWRDQVEQWGVARADEVPRDMLPGGRQSLDEVAGVRLGTLICFDVAFGDTVADAIAQGAELLVVQTSNATFAGTDQLDQQLAITRARAIETGRAVVVAATTGISAIIGPDGRVVARSRGAGAATLLAEVPVLTTRTLSATTGPWLLPLSIVSLVLAAIGRLVARRRPWPSQRASRHAG